MRVTWIAETNHEADCESCNELIDELLTAKGHLDNDHINGTKDNHTVALLRSSTQNVTWGE